MSAVMRALRGNPHFLNFVLLSGATLAPILYYVERRAPTSEQVENTLVSDYRMHVHVRVRARAHELCSRTAWLTLQWHMHVQLLRKFTLPYLPRRATAD